jgi:quercetin dioxygenase-like cupin family protein
MAAGARSGRARQGELDVLVIVLDGHGSAIIDGESHDLAAGSAILIPRGTPSAHQGR